MITVISPAKNLDYDTPAHIDTFTQPELLEHSEELMTVCRELSPQQIGSLMKISDKLSGLNAARFSGTEMPPWQHVQTHSHTWGQLAYTSDGVLGVHTPAGKFVIPPDQALWLPPNLPHETFCRYGGHFRSVYIDEKYVKVLGNEAKLLHVNELLKAMILEVCNWPPNYQPDDKKLRFTQVFIDQLECAQTSSFFMPTAQDDRLLPIISELHANPGCNKTLEQWGELVGASTRTLNRLFHKSFSMNFSQWKQKLRGLRAVEMIEAGYTQQTIAEQLGFESSSAFNTAFKKVFNCTPGQYLKR